jgi:hypothetical protein
VGKGLLIRGFTDFFRKIKEIPPHAETWSWRNRVEASDVLESIDFEPTGTGHYTVCSLPIFLDSISKKRLDQATRKKPKFRSLIALPTRMLG